MGNYGVRIFSWETPAEFQWKSIKTKINCKAKSSFKYQPKYSPFFLACFPFRKPELRKKYYYTVPVNKAFILLR